MTLDWDSDSTKEAREEGSAAADPLRLRFRFFWRLIANSKGDSARAWGMCSVKTSRGRLVRSGRDPVGIKLFIADFVAAVFFSRVVAPVGPGAVEAGESVFAGQIKGNGQTEELSAKQEPPARVVNAPEVFVWALHPNVGATCMR